MGKESKWMFQRKERNGQLMKKNTYHLHREKCKSDHKTTTSAYWMAVILKNNKHPPTTTRK